MSGMGGAAGPGPGARSGFQNARGICTVKIYHNYFSLTWSIFKRRYNLSWNNLLIEIL